MSLGPLIADVLLTFCLAASILYRYGNWEKQNKLVTIAVLIAWYFSFLIIFVLPLDVSSTVFRQCLEENIHTSNDVTKSKNETILCEEPWSYVPENVLRNLWRVVYWSSQFLTWLVLPLMQSYAKAGEFTVKGKLKSALIDNAIYYGSYLFICGILLIYIAFKPGLHLDWQKLKAIASSASNTWGLLLLVGLLGYSLVDIPRSLWLSTTPGYRLQQAYFKVAKMSTDKCDADEALDDVLESVHAMVDLIRPGDSLYKELEVVINKIPLQVNQRAKTRIVNESMVTPSLKSLVRIHKQLIRALHTAKRCETQWDLALEKAIVIEDITKGNRNRSSTSGNSKFFFSPKLEWYWRYIMRDRIIKFTGVVTAILSACVVWSELTFFNRKPVLSIFALIIYAAETSYDYFTIEILSTIMIAYLCFCAYSTVLKIRILNYYYLAPNHQTDEHSLIFSGMMLCRLTPPLCLNFLGLIHMDNHIIKEPINETLYTHIMGHMQVLSIISDGFNIYFPMAVSGFCLATYFSLGSRLLSLIGFQQFLDDDELTTELVDEGRELVARERRKRQRSEETAERIREYNERFMRSAFNSTGVTPPTDNNGRDNVRPSRTTVDPLRSNLLDDAEAIAVDNDFEDNLRGSNPPRRLFDDI